jgi:hypothetical protein
MIDWFILLVPLSVLPVILIFGFIGCTLDRRGSPPVPALHFPAGLNLSLNMIEVTMTVSGSHEQKSGFQHWNAVDIPPAGGVLQFSIDVASIDTNGTPGEGMIGPDLTADCSCLLTIRGDSKILQLDAHHDSLADFEFSGSGLDRNNYSLK